MRVLAADVGGTKTWLAVYEVSEPSAGTARWEAPSCRALRDEKLPSAQCGSLEELTRAFLGDERVHHAAFGLAGPVEGDTAKLTNLPWRVESGALRDALGAQSVTLINDFHAMALGIELVAPEHRVVLQRGETDPHALGALLGAGTGLGEALFIGTETDADGRRVFSTEGGHADFGPRDDLEIDLLRFLRARHGRVSTERVVSGQGIADLYDFVVTRGHAETTDAVRDAIEGGADPGATIGEAALAERDAACVMAVDRFVSLYGAEAGNVALRSLPGAGLFVGGGVAAKLIERIKAGGFIEAMLDKGRMRSVLERFEVVVVTDPKAGLLGARQAAIRAAART